RALPGARLRAARGLPRSRASPAGRAAARARVQRASPDPARPCGRVLSGGPAGSEPRRRGAARGALPARAARIPACRRRRHATLPACRTSRPKPLAMSSRQKPRLLPAETQPRSDKAPQTTLSHRLVRAARAAGARACARRSRARGALLAFLAELLANPLALEVRQVVDEELAVEMIHIVLDAHVECVLVVAREDGAVAFLRAEQDLRRSLHLIE